MKQRHRYSALALAAGMAATASAPVHAQAPSPSDILFSWRFDGRAAPATQSAALQAAEGFHATVLWWHYTSKNGGVYSTQPFITLGMKAQCTINNHVLINAQSTADEAQACLGADGLPLNAIVAGKYIGDARQREQLQKTLIADAKAAGCNSVQYDDGGTNFASALTGDRDGRKGCYGSISQFNTFLKDRLAPAYKQQLPSLDITTTGERFDYAKYVRGEYSFQNAALTAELQSLFMRFSEKVSNDHLGALRNEVRNVIGASGTLMANTAYWPYFSKVMDRNIDWVNTELPLSQTDPFALTQFIAPFKFTGKRVVLNPVLRLQQEPSPLPSCYGSRPIPVMSTEQRQTDEYRRVTMSGYALGAQAVAPWDIYMCSPGTFPGACRTGEAERYFGDPARFADVFSLISGNKSLFDNYVIDGHMGFMETSRVTKKTPHPSYPNVIALDFEGIGTLKAIPAGSQVTINDRTYVTAMDTTVGALYLAKSDADQIGVCSAVRQITPTNSRQAIEFTRRFTPLPYVAANVDYTHTSGPKAGQTEARLTLSSEKLFAGLTLGAPGYAVFKPAGSGPVAVTYTQDANARHLVVSAATAQAVPRGAELTYLRTGFEAADFLNRGQSLWTVGSAEFPLDDASRTMVKLVSPTGQTLAGNVPLGTSITLPGITASTSSSSGVGNFYFAGDVRDKIKVGDPVIASALPALAPSATTNSFGKSRLDVKWASGAPAAAMEGVLVSWGENKISSTPTSKFVVHVVRPVPVTATTASVNLKIVLPATTAVRSIKEYKLGSAAPTSLQIPALSGRELSLTVPPTAQWHVLEIEQ